MTFDTARVPLSNAIVSARISKGPHTWKATVLLSRGGGERPIQRGDVSVELFDAGGGMTAVDHAAYWIEAGGAAGTTANGTIEFVDRGAPPVRIRIMWNGESADLQVHSTVD